MRQFARCMMARKWQTELRQSTMSWISSNSMWDETTMVYKGNLRKTLVRISRRIAMKRAHVMEVKKQYWNCEVYIFAQCLILGFGAAVGIFLLHYACDYHRSLSQTFLYGNISTKTVIQLKLWQTVTNKVQNTYELIVFIICTTLALFLIKYFCFWG